MRHLVRRTVAHRNRETIHGHRDPAPAGCVEIPGLDGLTLGDHEVVCVDPRVVGCIEARAAVGDRHARGQAARRLVHHLQVQVATRPQVATFANLHRLLTARIGVDEPEGRVAIPIGDEGNRLVVGRPAGVRVVVIPVRQRKRVAPADRQQPELLPLSSDIAAVDDSRAVPRRVGPRAPRRFLVVQEPGLTRSVCRQSNQVAGAMCKFAVRDEDDLLAVARPRRVDRMIEGAVVVARNRAPAIRRQRAG